MAYFLKNVLLLDVINKIFFKKPDLTLKYMWFYSEKILPKD